jgi:hypothetical protein
VIEPSNRLSQQTRERRQSHHRDQLLCGNRRADRLTKETFGISINLMKLGESLDNIPQLLKEIKCFIERRSEWALHFFWVLG